MNFINKINLLLVINLFFSTSIYSLTNDEITKFCKRNKKKEECIKTLKIKRYNLKKGLPIEIPILPFKK